MYVYVYILIDSRNRVNLTDTLDYFYLPRIHDGLCLGPDVLEVDPQLFQQRRLVVVVVVVFVDTRVGRTIDGGWPLSVASTEAR